MLKWTDKGISQSDMNDIHMDTGVISTNSSGNFWRNCKMLFFHKKPP